LTLQRVLCACGAFNAAFAKLLWPLVSILAKLHTFVYER